MAPRELDPRMPGGRDGHHVSPIDVERVEQLGERIRLVLRRAADGHRRVVVARAGGLDDGEPVLGQPLVPEPRVTRDVTAVEDKDRRPGPRTAVLDRSTMGVSNGSAWLNREPVCSPRLSVAASTSGGLADASPHQLVEPRRERSRAEALEDRARVVDGGLHDRVVGPEDECHVQDHVRLLVDEPHLGELGEDRGVFATGTVAIAVVCAERGPDGLPLDVKDTTVERRGVNRIERAPHTLEITRPQRGTRGAREVHRCICRR